MHSLNVMAIKLHYTKHCVQVQNCVSTARGNELYLSDTVSHFLVPAKTINMTKVIHMTE